MKFSIQFSSNNGCNGSITLGEHLETFRSSFGCFSRAQYEQQWINALKIILEERRPTALFVSVEIGDDGVGTLWLYPIVASEFAGDTDDKRMRLSDFPDQEDAGVYIGERFMPVTVDVSNFERRIYLEFEDGSKGDEIALYYLDLSAPERFFGYLGDDIADVSHWYYSNSDLEAFLTSQ
ncbi:hypothetical protein SAMN05444273_103205 [Litoreibacter ascidiaceicola]|uniref:Uncharacterized protein n=1 Tax=Litoreibacter ascidiaceicola TaxID=1486859 RepID=A0A1M4XKU9_9RHOB|nr:hypothetical protein [Litoreibacter ascidiaceicola]SHE93812.1 hypothetical protein SAMN05444273_103205 [Litoreibacter ascidiaceicola]